MRERERDASSVINHFFSETKLLLYQNNGELFRIFGFVILSICYLISDPKLPLVTRYCLQGAVTSNYSPRYTKYHTNRQGKQCMAVLLLFCCRSESALSIYLSDSRFHYAVRCRDCTLLPFSDFQLITKDIRRDVLHTFGIQFNIFFIGRIQYTPTMNIQSSLGTYNLEWITADLKSAANNYRITNPIERKNENTNKNNKRVLDPNTQTNNNEKENSFTDGSILIGDSSCTSGY